MSPKIVDIEREEKGDYIRIKRILSDEILGKIHQVLILTKDKAVRRTWSAWGYGETRLQKITVKDGKPALDVVWGHEGEGRSDWYWAIIVPPDPHQIDRVLSFIKDYETFETVIERLHEKILSKNRNKRIDADLSFVISDS
jgi:hypothetical protein